MVVVLKNIFLAAFFVMFVPMVVADTYKEDGSAVISNLTEKVILELSENEDRINDEEYLRGVVQALILPDVDSVKLAQVVLGGAHRDMLGDQRAAFEAGFMKLLVGTYATALSTFDNHTYEIKGVQQSKRMPNYIRVSVELKSRSGNIVIQYSMFENNGVFKIYDVGVDGVFLTKTFKNVLRSAYQEGGFDKLMDQIDDAPGR